MTIVRLSGLVGAIIGFVPIAAGPSHSQPAPSPSGPIASRVDLTCAGKACTTGMKEFHVGKHGKLTLRVHYAAPAGVTFVPGTCRGQVHQGGNKFHVHCFDPTETDFRCEWYAEGSGPAHDNAFVKGECLVDRQ